MSVPNVVLGNSFDEWRIKTNDISLIIGDLANISPDQTFSPVDLVVTINDLYTKKYNRSGGTISGNTAITGTLTVDQTTTLSDALNVVGNLNINTNKFNVISSSGNTSIAGTLSVAGLSNLQTLNVVGACDFDTIPTTLTAALNDNSTKLATTAYYQNQASDTAPLMNGPTATIGSSFRFARQDHVHLHDSTRLTVANPSSTGTLTINGGTVTSNTPLINAFQTWNSGATTFKGLILNITETAASAQSLILDIQLNSLPRFGVDVNGAVIQKLSGTFLARDIVAGSRHVREFQDMNDASVNGLPATKIEWGFTWNAGWNGSLYVKDRGNANDHAIMHRIDNSFRSQWWFCDGSSPTMDITFLKKIDHDFFAGTAWMDLSLHVVDNLTIGTTGSPTITCAASTGFITAVKFIGPLNGNADTVTNGVVTTGSYADPTWITSLNKTKVGLGAVENTTLSTWNGTTNITTLGTIATGTWNADTISRAKGGTGITTSGTSYQLLGMNQAANSLEYKTIVSSDGTISITNINGQIDVKTSGIFPGSTTFSGDLTVGSPAKFSVSSATGNTSISGTLTVASTTSLQATSVTTVAVSTSITSPLITTGDVDRVYSTLTTTTTTPDQVILELPIAVYRSATFSIQGVCASLGTYHIASVNAIHNGTIASSVEYGATTIGGICGTFNVDISTGKMRLLVTPAAANSTVFKVNVTTIKI